MPWFERADVWAVIVSIIAIALSQVPYVSSWFASAELSVEIGKRIGLLNTVGITGLQLLLILKNKGQKSATISNLYIELTYPNGTIKRKDAQCYLRFSPGESSGLEFPISSINLNAGSIWSESVAYYADYTPSDEEGLNNLRLKMSQDISSKIDHRGGMPGPLVTASDILIAEATSFFDKKFDLEKGGYNLAVKGKVNGEDKLLLEAKFILYDFSITTIESQKDDYRYGWGIFSQINPAKHAWVNLSK